jgi:hypothetical protein
MKTATNGGHPITTGLDAPTTAICPECGATAHLCKRQFQRNCVQPPVALRSWLCQIARQRMDGATTYFYRHKQGQGDDCPRRYQPTR